MSKTVFYGLSATVCLSLGRGLQKYGVESIAHPARIFREKGYRFRFLVWCAGTAGMVASTFLTFTACAYGPVTIVAALSGVGLVALAIFAAFVLREKIGRAEIQAIALILAGTLLAGYFERWPRFKSYGFTPDTAAAVWPAPVSSIHLPNLVVFALVAASISIALVFWCVRHGYRGAGVILGGVAGIGGGMSVFFQKACMIRCTCDDIFADIPAALRNPFFYLFIATGLADFAIVQIALAKAKAVTVVPSYQALYIIIPIAGGVAAYYDQGNAIQLAGIALLIWGVVRISGFLGRSEIA
ncbi:EamA family transporter [bacterium]|nr:EamA family transporter [bacterium]